MAEQEEDKKPFVVKDRRRFDASGNVRSSETAPDKRSEPAPRPPAPPVRGGAPRAEAPRAEPRPAPRAEPARPAPPPLPELEDDERAEWAGAQREAKDLMDAVGSPRGPVSFPEFVLSLATNAVIHLGGDVGDGRVPPRVNLTLAAQHIDIIAMLAEKTKGNLVAEEQELLDSLLYDLRMRYVAVAQAQARGR